MEIKTKKEYEDAVIEYNAAQYFYTASCDAGEIKKAGEKINELEKAFESCLFEVDECNCDVRTKLVGDGCEKCNPEYAISMLALDRDGLQKENERLEAKVKEQAEELEAKSLLKNDIPVPFGATHYAKLPDNTFLFYKLGNESLLWFPVSKVWGKSSLIPYTLYYFDEDK